MKVVITGGAGFIGYYVVRFLRSKNFNVLVYDSFMRAFNELKYLKKLGVNVWRGDIRSFSGFLEMLKRFKPDVIVHLAAFVDVGESLRKPLSYFRNNALGTAVVAEACRRVGVEKVVYASSAAVYGEPRYLPIDEEHPAEPLSPYGLSKLVGELVLRQYARNYGLKVTVLRLFNVYGSGQNPAYAGVISRFIERAIAGKPLIIYGDGLQTRDFVHVEDVAEAFYKAIVSDVTGVFNVGSGKPTRIIDLVAIVREVAGGNVRVKFAPPRKGDIRHSYASIEKARRELRWEPRRRLKEELRKMLSLTK